MAVRNAQHRRAEERPALRGKQLAEALEAGGLESARVLDVAATRAVARVRAAENALLGDELDEAIIDDAMTALSEAWEVFEKLLVLSDQRGRKRGGAALAEAVYRDGYQALLTADRTIRRCAGAHRQAQSGVFRTVPTDG